MKPSQAQVLAAIKELKTRRNNNREILDEKYPLQARFVEDPSQFIIAFCTRRAGKTHGIAQKLLNKGKKYPGCHIPYIALTRESAHNIIWPVFQEINETQSLGLEFVESDLLIRMRNGAQIKLYGADQKNFIARLLGGKYPIVGIDEGQSFRSHLQALIDDVLTAAISDYPDGQIVLCGTPGPVKKGYFYDATEKGEHGFKVHRWRLFENPYHQNPRGFVEELIKRKGWDWSHPTIRRDYLGEWCADTDALVYKFQEELNESSEVPHLGGDWLFVLGVDLGYSPDPSAFVLGAYNRHDRRLFVIKAEKHLELTVSGVAEKIQEYQRKYPRLFVVADLGGQGKMIGAEITNRFGIDLLAADKRGKEDFIEIMNSDFKDGVIKLLPEAKVLKEEYQELLWDTEKEKRVEDSRYPNHCTDAALYMWRHCYNYAANERPEEVPRGSEKEIDKLWEQKAREIRSQQQDNADF